MFLNKHDQLKRLLDLENCVKMLSEGISKMRLELEEEQDPTKKKLGLDINQKLKLRKQLVKTMNKEVLKKVA